jgi:hypothetical protein
MMAEVLRLAAEDSGAGQALLERADSLQCIEAMSWRAPDPAAAVAGFLGSAVNDSGAIVGGVACLVIATSTIYLTMTNDSS